MGDAWDPVREIDAYPPSTGVLALYEKVSRNFIIYHGHVRILIFRDYLNHANAILHSLIFQEKFYKMFNDTVAAFDKMEAITVNPMFKNSSFKFCIESFKGKS